MNRAHHSTRSWTTWVPFVALWLVTACGQPAAGPGGTADDAADDAAEDVAADDALDDAAEDIPSLPDVAADVPTDVPDVAVDDTPDTPDVPECVIDDDCAAKVSLSPCELAVCKAGTCGKAKNPDACCVDSDCNDQLECTIDKCDQLKHACNNVTIANCCSGQVLLQNAGFEAGLDGFTVQDGPKNGNVTWQASQKRVHGGKQSLYFGNACHTYDTSMTVGGTCNPSLTGQQEVVSTTLTSKPWFLPKSLKAQAHFWLWLDTEPPYSKTLQSGTCVPPCNALSTCINVAGASVCEPEKDVLSVQVLTADAPPAPVFVSTSIGKTTLGDPAHPDGWRHVAIDLAPWQGKSVQLAFQFGTITNLKNGYEGIYLDDLVVETICANGGITCTADGDCDNDGLPCTADTCTSYANGATPGTGVCFHDFVAGCCLGDLDCDDGNGCTKDTCAANECSHAPDAVKPGCCTPSTQQADTFNGPALTGWTALDTNSIAVNWRLDPAGGNPTPGNGEAPGGAIYFGTVTKTGYADPQLPVPQGPKGMLCAKSLVLPAGTVFNLLTFDLNLDTEWSDVGQGLYVNPPVPGKPKLDWFSVQIATGGKYYTAWSSDEIAGTTGGKWQPITVSLDAWAGKSVQVCYRFEAGDNVLNSKNGPWVDNVALTVACQKPACFWNSDCAGTPCKACEAPVCAANSCACAAVATCP